MNEYTASNGVTVHHGGEDEPLNGVRLESDRAVFVRLLVSGEKTQALREFFQAEADERLSRWRDPRWPGIVGYGTDSPDRMLVLNEGTGRVKLRARHGDSRATWREFADAYFALALIAREHRKDPRAAAHYCRMYLLYDSRSPRAAQAARWIEDAEGGGKGGG